MNTKTIKVLKKVISISFIVLFVIFLTIPNTGLPREKENIAIIAKENRQITSFPQASTVSKKFYTEFEKWYQDRLRHRDIFISFWKQTNFNLGVILKDNIFLGKYGWLFDKYRCIRNFSDANKKIETIKKLQNYCNNNGIDFILMVPPIKESIYRDYLPQTLQLKYKNPKYWQNKAEILFSKNKINYLSITNQLENQRKTEKHDLYFKDDHHWSYYASATAADLLMNKIEKDLLIEFYQGLNLDGTTKKATKEYSYANQLGIQINRIFMAPWSKKYRNELYVKDSSTGKTRKINTVISNNIMWGPMVKGEGIVINKNINNDIKLLILGDSYSSYMIPYLSQNINQIVLSNYNTIAGRKKDVNINKLIKNYKPDVITLIINEGAFFNHSNKELFGKLKY